MENEIINALANEIVEKLKGKIFNIKTDMEEFLKAQISEENKEKALEQLYLFQLYSNAYVGPDPRGLMRMFGDASSVLTSKNDEDLLNKIEKLKQTTEFMKSYETHPLQMIKQKLEDKEKYKGVKF